LTGEIDIKARSATILAVAGALLAPVAAYPAGTKDTAPTMTEKAKEGAADAAVTTKVKAAFAKDKDVSALKINVDTDKGVVKLSGEAKTKEEADKAVSIAKGIEGVVSVTNNTQMAGK